MHPFLKKLQARFTSGNSMPVDRAFLTAAEYAELQSILASETSVSASQCECAMGEFACSDRAQCFEPCGVLGHDVAHAVAAPVPEHMAKPPRAT